MNSLFLLLSLINIFLLFLVRFLAKKNIFINSIGYFSVFFQVLIIFSSVLRERNFPNIPFNFTLLLIFFSNSIITLSPYVLNKVLSEPRKQKLAELEENVKVFLLNLYDEFLEKRPKLSKICWVFSEKLNLKLSWMITKNYYFFLIILPWLFFINFLFLETIVTQKFVLSPYFYVYFLFLYRILSILTYITKNTRSFYYITPLRKNFLIDFPEITVLNFVSLKELVLDSPKIETKQDKLIAWRNLNIVLSFSCEYFKMKYLYYFDLPNLKKVLDFINFGLISLSEIFSILLSFNFSYNFICLTYFLGFFSIFFCLLFYFKTFLEDPEIIKFKTFLEDLPDFLDYFKLLLIKEHDFLSEEIVINKPLINYFYSTNIWMLIITKIFVVLLIFVFIFFICYCSIFSSSFYFFCNLEHFIFFHKIFN